MSRQGYTLERRQACERCGIRRYTSTRTSHPLCNDCIGVLTPEQRKEWMS